VHNLKVGIIAPCEVFPPISGAPKRVYRIAQELSACGAEVTVLHHGQQAYVNGKLRFLSFKPFSISPGSSDYFHPFNPYFPSFFGRFMNEFKPDIVQCEGPWSILPALFYANKMHVPCVLDEHNVEVLWSLFASKVPFIAPYTFVFEKFALNNSKLILTTSETDKIVLSRIFQVDSKRLFVVPNGVDFRQYSAASGSLQKIKSKLGILQSKKIVLYHGLMSSKQNYEAASLIIDYIAPKIGIATFLIIGKNPPTWLKKSAQGKTNVLVLDYVPNIEDYIMASDLCIAPIIRGSGTRLKILEYMAAGKPIVSTVKGAEGIPLKSGVNAILLDKVDSCFVDSVQYLLLNEVAARELGSAAKRLSMRFNWKCIGQSLYDFYINVFEKN
jgi:polysaccharide biosynthesis protein PslH